jgi:hypothetical protein
MGGAARDAEVPTTPGGIGHPEIVHRVVPVRQMGHGWPCVTSCLTGSRPVGPVVSLSAWSTWERLPVVQLDSMAL